MRKVFLLFIFSTQILFAQKIENILHKGASISMEHLLQKYVQIPSLSGEEKIAGDFIKDVAKENGLFITEFGKTNGNYNFAASVFPLDQKKPNIIFLNHIDVVPEHTNITRGPYSGVIEGDMLYGRGAIDNKGAALMQLFSIVQFSKFSNDLNKYNITFLPVSSEETQSKGGVDYVIKNHLTELNSAVVIGEGPSEITALLDGDFDNAIYGISTAHKRSLWLHLELEIETTGHGSITPNTYSNKELVRSLHKLTKKKCKIIYNELNISILKHLSIHKKGFSKFVLNHPRLFKPIITPKLRKQPELLSLFTNTITLTNVFTDSNTYNVIPSTSSAYVDCRLLPETDQETFLKLIKKRLNNDQIKIEIFQSLPQTNSSSTQNIYYKSLDKIIKSYYPNSKTLPLLMPNVNDLGAFRAMNIPAYGSVPVNYTKEEVESIHNKNERISIPLLYDGAEIYLNLIEELQQH